jgi:hypothetical protein
LRNLIAKHYQHKVNRLARKNWISFGPSSNAGCYFSLVSILPGQKKGKIQVNRSKEL